MNVVLDEREAYWLARLAGWREKQREMRRSIKELRAKVRGQSDHIGVLNRELRKLRVSA